jgi:hypothetical protein
MGLVYHGFIQTHDKPSQRDAPMLNTPLTSAHTHKLVVLCIWTLRPRSHATDHTSFTVLTLW